METQPPAAPTEAAPSSAYDSLHKQELGPVPFNDSTLYTDPIVAVLAEKDRPQKEVVCQRCPGAMWQTGIREVKCFCSQMRVYTWTTAEPKPLTRCTGQIRMLDKLAAELAGGK